MRKLASILLCCALLLSVCAGCHGSDVLSWQDMYDLGVRYLEEGNIDQAIIAFQTAIQIDPKKADAYISLADAYVAQGNTSLAEECLTDALDAVDDREIIQLRLDELNAPPPDDSGASSSTASSSASSSAPEDHSEPEQPAAPTWQDLYNQGQACLQSGDYQGAIDAFNAAIALDATNPDEYIGLADAWVAMGNPDQAIQILTNALGVVSDPSAIQQKLNELAPPQQEEEQQPPQQEPEQQPEPEQPVQPEPQPAPEPQPQEPLTEPQPEPQPQPEPEQPQTSGTPIEGSNLSWSIDNGTLKLSGTGAMPDYSVNEELSFYPPWWEWDISSGIVNTVIENGVSHIGAYAFEGCGSLVGISIPGSVTSIGEFAFSGCNSLRSIAIPYGVTTIEASTFYGCSGLTSVSIPGSVTAIDTSAFGLCSSLTSISIPASVKQIGYYAFDDCNNLTDIYYGGTKEEWESATATAEIPEYIAIYYNS